MKIFTKIYLPLFIGFLALTLISCEQEQLEDALEIADGGGALTNFKAYSLDSIPGEGGMYGRAVFWLGIDGNTLLQISLYNVPEDGSYPSAIYSGSVDTSGTELMELYPIANTGDGYDFGEFAAYKYYVISDPDFYGSLEELDANIQILSGSTPVVVGGIGINAVPVESN